MKEEERGWEGLVLALKLVYKDLVVVGHDEEEDGGLKGHLEDAVVLPAHHRGSEEQREVVRRHFVHIVVGSDAEGGKERRTERNKGRERRKNKRP